SPLRTSWRILPGSSSRKSSTSLPWSSPSRWRAPRASSGPTPPRLQRRDECVAPEERHEPGQAGGRQDVRLTAELAGDPERREVDHGLIENALQQGAVGLEGRYALHPLGERALDGRLRLAEALVHRAQGRVVQAERDLEDGDEEMVSRQL